MAKDIKERDYDMDADDDDDVSDVSMLMRMMP